MVTNRTRTDQLHDKMPAVFNTRTNTNWKAVVEALGGGDQDVLELIEAVRKQFFVDSAQRPYLDRIGARNKVQRPRFVGMNDDTFRKFVPLLAFHPKQVKIVLDKLVDIFFFREVTTSFIEAGQDGTYLLKTGWTLEYIVDQVTIEKITFTAADFTTIAAATAIEVASVINRQAKDSFAVVFEDVNTKKSRVRIFTNTIGAKGSVKITGGRAQIALQMDGFIADAGTGTNTQWAVTKIGDEVSLRFTTGDDPCISKLEVDDIIAIDVCCNCGTFALTDVSPATNTIKYKNLFATSSTRATGTITVTIANCLTTDVFTVGTTTYTEGTDFTLVAACNNATAIAISNAINNDLDVTIECATVCGAVVTVRAVGGQSNNTTPLLYTDGGTAGATLSGASLGSGAGEIVQSSANDIKFFAPFEANVYLKSRRAIVWEVTPGEITVEIPPTPPVVRRERSGSAHLNGIETLVTCTASLTSLVLCCATCFPCSGIFFLEESQEVLVVNVICCVTTTDTNKNRTRIASDQNIYTYTGKTCCTITGITPCLPRVATTNQFCLTSANRACNIISAITTTAHNYSVGECAIISGVCHGAGTVSINGTWDILTVPTTTTFTATSSGDDRCSCCGDVRVERVDMGCACSKVILKTAILQPCEEGPYIWDTNACFVVSFKTTTLTTAITAGSTATNIFVATNCICNSAVQLIFEFGTSRQEGPVRAFFKPNSTSIAIDPAFIFEFSHAVCSGVTQINKRGGIEFDGLGGEFAPYITDPSTARVVLEELMEDVKSVGIFLNFLVRFPDQFYGVINVYNDPCFS